MEKDYLSINRQLWDNKTALHIASDFYDHKSFLAGRNTLIEVEREMLGDIQGKKVLHLQCHFGQDSLSMARMGAKVTGVDLSKKAIEEARATNDELGLNAEFICCDVFQLDKHLNDKYDIIFTSFGVIGWLPELSSWAKIIKHFLNPEGRLVFAEFHSLVWMFDDDFKNISYSYFNRGVINEEEEGTYADRDAKVKAEFACWNHSLGDVFTALHTEGLKVNFFQEFDYTPHPCFRNLIEIGPRKYQIKGLEGKLPMFYALQAHL